MLPHASSDDDTGLLFVPSATPQQQQQQPQHQGADSGHLLGPPLQVADEGSLQSAAAPHSLQQLLSPQHSDSSHHQYAFPLHQHAQQAAFQHQSLYQQQLARHEQLSRAADSNSSRSLLFSPGLLEGTGVSPADAFWTAHTPQMQQLMQLQAQMAAHSMTDCTLQQQQQQQQQQTDLVHSFLALSPTPPPPLVSPAATTPYWQRARQQNGGSRRSSLAPPGVSPSASHAAAQAATLHSPMLLSPRMPHTSHPMGTHSTSALSSSLALLPPFPSLPWHEDYARRSSLANCLIPVVRATVVPSSSAPPGPVMATAIEEPTLPPPLPPLMTPLQPSAPPNRMPARMALPPTPHTPATRLLHQSFNPSHDAATPPHDPHAPPLAVSSSSAPGSAVPSSSRLLCSAAGQAIYVHDSLSPPSSHWKPRHDGRGGGASKSNQQGGSAPTQHSAACIARQMREQQQRKQYQQQQQQQQQQRRQPSLLPAPAASRSPCPSVSTRAMPMPSSPSSSCLTSSTKSVISPLYSTRGAAATTATPARTATAPSHSAARDPSSPHTDTDVVMLDAAHSPTGMKQPLSTVSPPRTSQSLMPAATHEEHAAAVAVTTNSKLPADALSASGTAGPAPVSPAPSLSLSPSSSSVSASASAAAAGPFAVSSSGQVKDKVCPHPGCHASFPKASTLLRHVRTHTGEKPFRCVEEGCTAAFAEKGNLVRHVTDIHEQVRRYSCPFSNYCQAKFFRAAHVEQHVQSKHVARGEDPRRAYLYLEPPDARTLANGRGRKRRRNAALAMAATAAAGVGGNGVSGTSVTSAQSAGVRGSRTARGRVWSPEGMRVHTADDEEDNGGDEHEAAHTDKGDDKDDEVVTATATATVGAEAAHLSSDERKPKRGRGSTYGHAGRGSSHSPTQRHSGRASSVSSAPAPTAAHSSPRSSSSAMQVNSGLELAIVESHSSLAIGDTATVSDGHTAQESRSGGGSHVQLADQVAVAAAAAAATASQLMISR